ncbi:DgyrCDS2105 [Dimorphilus gyrociliatus]|uniref:DgyrCDS2105 n=1 Tax=Dimorphilus gyrociliatus TaxID=2664684 RepID=A0A7I8V9A2_9ANNE|nr:DgyrCDS2105 [Dimorphilus gyrociliatus]
MTNHENWMGNLPDKFHNMPLNKIAIPGSHNSSSSTLKKSNNISPDQPSAIKNLGTFVKPIVYNWSVCQDKSITDQLKLGIRYLDIRVCTNGNTDELFTFHGLFSQTIESLLIEVREFLENHSKEVVFLDFNHFCEVSNDQHEKLVKMIEDYMNPFISVSNYTIESICLNGLWEKKIQALVFYQSEKVKNCKFLTRNSIISPWANTEEFEELLPYLQIMLEDDSRKDRFHVCQMILTPKTDTVLKGLLSNLRSKMCTPYFEKMINWMNDQYTGYDHGLNIVIRDFIDEQFTDKVVKLNYEKCLYE